MLSDSDFLRYSRQIMLPVCGEEGIERLARRRVAIVGLGGLGVIAAPYLAAAGVGHLSLIDDDTVSLSNLPRQWLYSPVQSSAEQSPYKADQLTRRLAEIQPSVQVKPVISRLIQTNAVSLLSDYDLILDCSDTMATRQLINQTAFNLGIPLITATATGMQAQAVALHPQHTGIERQGITYGCYRCLYPFDDLPDGSCQTQGVLGPVVGMAGCYQATLALRALLNDSSLQWSVLWRIDCASFAQGFIHITQTPDCPVCARSTARQHP